MDKDKIEQIVEKAVNEYIDSNCLNPDLETISELPTWAVMFSLALNGNQPETRTMFGVPADSAFNAQVAVIKMYDSMAKSLGIDDMDIKIISTEREYLDT